MEKKYNYTYMIYINDPESKLYGKVYFGQHRTDNLLDGYVTCGTIVGRYIKKHPDGYYRKILNFYNTAGELNKAEYDLIHPHLGKPYCLNIVEGGSNYTPELREKASVKISKTLTKLWQDPDYRNHMCKKQQERTQYASGYNLSDETKQKQRERKLQNPTKYWEGKKLPEDVIERRTATFKKNYKGRSEEETKRRSESLKGKNKGKHKVWDNKELNIYHMER